MNWASLIPLGQKLVQSIVGAVKRKPRQTPPAPPDAAEIRSSQAANAAAYRASRLAGRPRTQALLVQSSKGYRILTVSGVVPQTFATLKDATDYAATHRLEVKRI